jgi:hypothetical protein
MPGAYLRSTPYPILYKRSQDRALSASASLSAYTSFNWLSWVPSFPTPALFSTRSGRFRRSARRHNRGSATRPNSLIRSAQWRRNR